jgi:DNA-binding transcriptional ArsR family regulator
VNDIVAKLHLAQPQVSKHLKVLKEAGLVDVEPRANQRVYGLRPQRLQELHGWIERYRALWEDRFEAMDAVIDAVKRKEEQHGRRKK